MCYLFALIKQQHVHRNTLQSNSKPHNSPASWGRYMPNAIVSMPYTQITYPRPAPTEYDIYIEMMHLNYIYIDHVYIHVALTGDSNLACSLIYDTTPM